MNVPVTLVTHFLADLYCYWLVARPRCTDNQLPFPSFSLFRHSLFFLLLPTSIGDTSSSLNQFTSVQLPFVDKVGFIFLCPSTLPSSLASIQQPPPYKHRFLDLSFAHSFLLQAALRNRETQTRRKVINSFSSTTPSTIHLLSIMATTAMDYENSGGDRFDGTFPQSATRFT